MTSLFDKLRDNAAVCFFGDSMTAGGAWIAEIYQNLIDNYPHRGIKLYNCGVAGDKSSHAIDRLYGDCLIFSPDCVCVMFGINDIDINAYLENDAEKQRSAMELYEKSMRKIVSECSACGAEVILCTPPPYDEISDVPAVNCRCGSGIDKCAEFVKKLADEYGCVLADFNLHFKHAGNNPPLIRPDRIHPNENGCHLMARVFMDTVGIEHGAACAELSAENQSRYETEQKLRTLAYVNYGKLYPQRMLDILEKYELVKRKIAEFDPENDNPFSMESMIEYKKEALYEPQLRAELIEKTVNIYKAADMKRRNCNA